MTLPANIRRLLRTAGDFEYALPIVSYYMKLYGVEQVLAMDGRTEEMTECATGLLDDIEKFKATENDDAVKLLLEDQTKAKSYLLNFALSLYNEQLLKIKEEKYDRDLSRALWCCVDLFNTIIDIWKGSELSAEEVEQCQKRVKYCKLYLRQLSRGEMGKESSVVPEASVHDQETDDLIAKLRKLDNSDESESNEEIDENIKPQVPELDVNPEEVNKFIKSLEEEYPSEGEDQEADDQAAQDLVDRVQNDDLDGDAASNAASIEATGHAREGSLELPCVPSFIDQGKDAEEESDEPQFVSDDSEKEEPAKGASRTTTMTHQYTPEDLTSMMDREEQISEVQKLARYAISALNYEDIGTAKDELTKALKVLEKMG